ncbi:NblA/ycf18 family protein [Lyngbya confervoides]|uniref:NblA/ycf18 family protein n=1 Tax=Lyngbya confervoides BDU141951 TaxID=1574623 RepID=A0ABD4T7Z5_9CYAN|nr:NblA/ycf18 family protein [Lyngbya confervoides]MCM1984630.1 NblA/ycf18 family protein [Lyngbya confervoides BDU141951]
MESAFELSLEQEFNLRSFEQQVDQLSEDQKNDYLLQTLKQLMIKNNVIKHLLTHRDPLFFASES